jgi:hypothetical protein
MPNRSTRDAIEAKPQMPKVIANMTIRVAALGIGSEEFSISFPGNLEVTVDLSAAELHKQKMLLRRICQRSQTARFHRNPHHNVT